MSYLSLFVDTARECRTASAPSTVTGNSGVLADISAWVAQAYTEIQQKHDGWLWLRSTFTVNTVIGTDTYAPADCTDSRLGTAISRFARWWMTDSEGYPNVSRYLTSGGVSTEQYLELLDWDLFRKIYKIGPQVNSAPIHITIDPQNNFVLGPKPDAVYTVLGEYQKAPQTLMNDSDMPEMPTRFHPLIMYRAMEKYGAANGAAEVFQRGGFEGGRIMRALERDQRAKIRFPPPLV